MKEKLYNILRWSEKYTKTDMLYIAKGGGSLFGGQIITTILALGLMVAFANLLPQNQYGVYRFLLSGLSIISVFSLTGMHNALARSVSKGAERSLLTAFKTQLQWNLIPSFLALGVGLYYFINNNNTLAAGFLTIALFFCIYKTSEIYDAFLIGKKMFNKRVWFNILHNAFNSIAVIVTIFLTHNVNIILLVYITSMTISLSLFYFRTKRFVNMQTPVDTEMVPYAKHLSIINGIHQFAQELDKILMFHYLGAAQLASYAFATAGPLRIDGFKISLKNLIYPKLSAQDLPTLKKSLPRKILILTGAISLVVLMYILAAPYLFQWFLPRYIDAVLYSQIFSLVLIFSPTILVISQTFIAQVQKRTLYKVRIINAMVKIALMAILIPLFGIWGAIIAFMGAKCIEAIVVSLFFYFTKTD